MKYSRRIKDHLGAGRRQDKAYCDASREGRRRGYVEYPKSIADLEIPRQFWVVVRDEGRDGGRAGGLHIREGKPYAQVITRLINGVHLDFFSRGGVEVGAA